MTPTIKNWTMVKAGDNMYLKGYVYNHPNRDYASDGDLIITSAIIEGGDRQVQCLDGVYNLEG